MSIRRLTTELQEEAREAHRRKAYRAEGPASEAGHGNRTILKGRAERAPARDNAEAETPAPGAGDGPEVAPSRSVGLRPRQEARWRVPGGIVSHFSRGPEEAPPDGDEPEAEAAEAKAPAPDAPEPGPEAPGEAPAIRLDFQLHLHDFILQRQPEARREDNILENVTLTFQDGGGALPVARFTEWPDALHISPTAGFYPKPGETWMCIVDAEGLVYPMERVK